MNAASARPGDGVPVLEVGGSHAAAALVVASEGRVVPGTRSRRALDPRAGADEVLAGILECGSRLPVHPGAHWGIALPGPFDYVRGVALFEGVGKFDSLYGIDVGRALRSGLPGPPGQLTFLNDAQAFTLGEWAFGAGKGHRRCVGITLGTGVGSCFLVDGEAVQAGAGVPPEGRADLLRIGGQPLEEVVSSRAIEAAYLRGSGSRASGGVEVAARARAGDMVANQVLESAFRQLGEALGPYLEKFGAEALVVGGAMTGSWDLLAAPLLVGLRARGWGDRAGRCVAVASMTDDAALVGAAAYVTGPARSEPGARRPLSGPPYLPEAG